MANRKFNKNSKAHSKQTSRNRRNGNVTPNNDGSSRSGANNHQCDDYGKLDKDGSNDPSWYAANPELLISAASLSYNNPLGNQIGIGRSTKFRNFNRMSFAGVLSLNVVPSPGYSDYNNSPVNIAARNVYSFVRHANSGASNYNAPDLMLYLLAIDSLYSFHAFLTRAYGILMTYSQTNRYYPQRLIESMGLDFNDLVGRGTDFNYYINALGAKISSLVYPANMTFTTRHVWMYSNIYTDGTNAKSQSYIYNPSGFYKFNAIKYKTGGCCEYTPWFEPSTTSMPKTFDQLVEYGNALVDALMEDEDSNIMSGDILKAYGSDKVMKIGAVPLDYTITPVFDMEVLTQINNATIIGINHDDTWANITGTGDTFNSRDIWQEDNNVFYKPTINFTNEAGTYFDALDIEVEQLVNMPIETPTAADTMVATRLKAFLDINYSEGSATSATIAACGSEYILTATLISIESDGTTGKLNMRYDNSFTTSIDGELFAPICDITNFDCAPLMITYDRTGSDNFSRVNFINDIQNFALLSYDTFYKMNETALLSMYTVPQFASARTW